MGVKVIEKGDLKIPKAFKCVLKVGFFDGKYPDGEYVASVAFWNEFGTISKNGNRHIPPRPFMRNVINDNSNMQKIANIAKIEFEKGTNVEAVADLLGGELEKMIKQSIRSGEFTPNSDYTIIKKGSSTPLIDTGFMLGSVSYKVEK